ncbi:hypothetical protein T440DRAFT_493128 [Plenodomus tracheiphilus IPT5]|uniref:Transcription regulator Rua1 C-terminal domain-containing protein n=1 Tax=Plenodomus tracheiphilus IPT5 TaxID=1408161 RepID=A0A6A7AT04_9PLEO|nr:hypothetical protein T440DRAFT_493128 [Plenodomus tracheiphilus IPT5]
MQTAYNHLPRLLYKDERSKMEFNAVQQYRPSPNRPYAMGQSSPIPGNQMMYTYGTHALPGQQQSQGLQQVSRPSPPQPTWAVPQTHNQYYVMPRGPPVRNREDMGQMARSNVHAAQSPAMSNAAYSNSMPDAGSLATTDYFPGVIDTSTYSPQSSTGTVLTNKGPWGQKVCEELEAFPSLDPDVTDFNHGMMGQDENTPIIDLRQYTNIGQPESEHAQSFNPLSTRRLSESSFSISSTGGVLPETTSYEELGSAEAISYAQDYEAWSHSEPSSSQLLSPLASPRRPQYEGVVRGGSRTRASPAPHNNVRSSPYTLESSRYKRWSTGHAPTSTPTSSRPMSQALDRHAPYGPRSNPHHSMPTYPSSAYNNFYTPAQQNVLYSHTHHIHSGNQSLYAPQDQSFQLEVPRPVPSQGLFRLLQSNADRHGGCSSHFADLSDPPDLYSSLHEEASNPPESDMNPSDPDLVPHEQDLRFNGDLYTPRWVRGHGNKREGWCGLCKPGRWLVLKNSAFWYDKSFTHGVSAATGAAFQGPQDTRRTEGNLDVWEGLCGSCGEWIALVSSKKKGTTWFRHAYKCHTHPKVKDGPKRRRETQAGRVRAASSASATSSSYPVKQETSQADALSHHSTPTPITGSGSLQSFGIPSASSSIALPNSIPSAATPHVSTTSYPSSTSYPTSASATPTASSFNESRMEPSGKHQPVVGMFTTPLQSLSSFSGGQSYAQHLAHQVSEPELVGIRTTTSSLNSIASMM